MRRWPLFHARRSINTKSDPNKCVWEEIVSQRDMWHYQWFLMYVEKSTTTIYLVGTDECGGWGKGINGWRQCDCDGQRCHSKGRNRGKHHVPRFVTISLNISQCMMNSDVYLNIPQQWVFDRVVVRELRHGTVLDGCVWKMCQRFKLLLCEDLVVMYCRYDTWDWNETNGAFTWMEEVHWRTRDSGFGKNLQTLPKY